MSTPAAPQCRNIIAFFFCLLGIMMISRQWYEQKTRSLFLLKSTNILALISRYSFVFPVIGQTAISLLRDGCLQHPWARAAASSCLRAGLEPSAERWALASAMTHGLFLYLSVRFSSSQALLLFSQFPFMVRECVIRIFVQLLICCVRTRAQGSWPEQSGAGAALPPGGEPSLGPRRQRLRHRKGGTKGHVCV